MPVAVRTKKYSPKPANPQADPRFRAVKAKVEQNAAKLKKHPTAKSKAVEAAKAAKGPPNEKNAGAKANQVDKMGAAEAKEVKTDSFLTILQAQIKSVMPKTVEDADKFMKGGEAGQMKSAVSGNVGKEKNAASADIKSASQQSPNPGGVQGKDAAPIPPEQPVATASVNAASGMPAPQPDAEISQQQNKADAEKAVKDNNLTPEQLCKANDPRFTKVLDSKDKVGKVSDASPAKFRAQEQSSLVRSKAQAQGQAARGATMLKNVSAKSKSAVLTRQQAAQKRDEDRRKAVADQIEGIYTATKQKVDKNLNSLEEDVVAVFDKGASTAISNFESNSNRDIENYKNKLGLIEWIAVKLSLLPVPLKSILDANLAKFEKEMNRLVVKVAGIVDTRLKQAKTEIDKGQQDIKTYVAGLPKDLQKVGKDAEEAVKERFDELRQSIEDKKNDLAQNIAARYKQAFEDVEASRKKLEEENKTVFDQLADAVGDVVKILTEFKDKLIAILKKGADTIDLILKDPIGFLSNLIAAIKAGVMQFKGNIKKHLITGFANWLFGALGEAGIEIPSDLSPMSLLKMLLSILGLSPNQLRAKAVKLLGPTAVAVIEKLYEYIKDLIEGGPAKLWEHIKSDVGDLKDMIVEALKSWLIRTIVEQGVIKLASFINPAGAIAQAVIAIYNGVMFLIERASQIMAFVDAVINSVSSIAQGAISSAANWIEKSLAGIIPLVLSLLARLLGLGKLTKKVAETIGKVQAKVDKAINKVLGKIIQTVKKLFGKLTGKGKKDKDKKDKDGKDRTDAEKEKAVAKAVAEAEAILDDDDKTAKDVEQKFAAIKAKHKITRMNMIVSTGGGSGEEAGAEETDKVEAVINTKVIKKTGKPVKKLKPHPSKNYVAVVGKKYMLKPAYQNKTFTRDKCYAKAFRTDIVNWKNQQISTPRNKGGLRHPTKKNEYYYKGTYYLHSGNTYASIDHKHSVANHWNSTGRKGTQEDRKDWYNKKSNLRIVPLSLNSSMGATSGENYQYRVTIKFRYP